MPVFSLPKAIKWPHFILMGALALLVWFLSAVNTAEATDHCIHLPYLPDCQNESGDEQRDEQSEATATFAEPQPAEDSFLDTNLYVRLADNTNVYAEPSLQAPVVRNTNAGFLFATVFSVEDVDGVYWYQINYGEFVHEDNVERREISQFRGIEVLNQPERPFGWIVQDVQPSDAPDEEPDPETEEMVRYTFFEVYDSVLGEDDWLWYQLENGQWIRQTFVSLVYVTEPPSHIGDGELWTQVDLYEQTFAAYEGERMVFASLISSGLNQWPTYEGTYQVEERFRYYKMSGAEGQSDYYFIEDVPHIMYFDFFNGIAFHGAYWHDRFGFKASHGCVNMPPYVSEWVFNWSEGADNELHVEVFTSDPLDSLE